MPTTDQFKALIQSHLAQDEERFFATALQAAAHAARQGHGRAADDIKRLVDDARARAPRRRPVVVTSPRGELSGLLAASAPTTRLSEMVLDLTLKNRLERVVREQREADKLRSFGLRPCRKLLLVGPPGVGKTMTAAALAGELHRPLYVVVLDALITRFMGETAAKLRLVFDAIAETPGVYLFDELDAIGTERAAGNDVGEIRRVLNSFLLFLEQDDSAGLIVAATNHPNALDSALFRRFDAVLEYPAADPALAATVARNRLSAFEVGAVDWGVVQAHLDGLSYAEVAAAAAAAAKEVVLADGSAISTAQMLQALDERRRTGRAG